MNYASIYKAIISIEGIFARRASWAPCRKIRGPVLTDCDFIPNHLEGVIIEDCKKECDCKIGIWIPANEDKKAEDWQIFDQDNMEMIPEFTSVERSVATDAQ